ncbi:MAG TPA: aspartyl-phosphate phosphatase Spo0E family protein [Clostridium sp.]|uniref:aspartyl-phosphate phosphatase Spo0E family protein n=1 Tax=Clostridium sp. TaxID=1506 RepID=UPI002F955363
MNIKLRILKKELESLRTILHFLLNFNKPTDKIVVSCSQQLDEVIVKYQKIKATLKKVA